VKTLITALYQAIEPLLQAAAARWHVRDAIPNALLLGNQDALIGALSNLVNNSLQPYRTAPFWNCALKSATVVKSRSGYAITARVSRLRRARVFSIPSLPRVRVALDSVWPWCRRHCARITVRFVWIHRGRRLRIRTAVANALAVADLPSGECLNYLTTAVASRPAVCGIN